MLIYLRYGLMFCLYCYQTFLRLRRWRNDFVITKFRDSLVTLFEFLIKSVASVTNKNLKMTNYT